MSVRNWFGMAVAVGVFVLFREFILSGHEVTAVSALAFGGGLVFAGVLIDVDHFVEIFRIWKGQK